MNSILSEYDEDVRLTYLRSATDLSRQQILAAKFFLYTSDKMGECNWHWIQYFYISLPPHSVAQEIAEICASVEQKISGLGCYYIDRLVSIRDRKKDDRDYDQIIQILAELLMINRILYISWPCDTIFHYEKGGRTGKSPELLVESEGMRFLFEVKAPSLIKHVKERQAHNLQVPYRMMSKKIIDIIAEGAPVTLPRDNPIRDFLINADEKFADFEKANGAVIRRG